MVAILGLIKVAIGICKHVDSNSATHSVFLCLLVPFMRRHHFCWQVVSSCDTTNQKVTSRNRTFILFILWWAKNQGIWSNGMRKVIQYGNYSQNAAHIRIQINRLTVKEIISTFITYPLLTLY